MMKSVRNIFLAAVVVLASCCTGGRGHGSPDEQENIIDSIPALGFWTEDYKAEEGSVRSGQNFIGMLGGIGVSQARATELATMCDTLFDVRRMRIGDEWCVYRDSITNEPAYFVYSNDRIHRTVFSVGDSLGIWKYEIPTQTVRKYADVTISSSLWNDMTKAGSSPQLILKLSDIYAWTVDFFGLQKEDRFRIIYDQKEVGGELLSIDTIYFARFTRDTTDIYAIMYDQGDHGNIYWNEKGESLRRAFLKAPLEFKRISSGFSYHRKHPVTGQVKAHTAVDYAAPTGTPVVSIGDGTVVSAGWAGGGGNTVKIRHNSVYTTSYMHLSKYGAGIKAGTQVRQGQVIGYVGATGTATGPHLDFRVYKNGTAINPLTMDAPPTEPIMEEHRHGLDSVFTAYKAEMDSVWRLLR